MADLTPEGGRIACNSVTEALMQAAEHAEEMDDVLILYYAKDGAKGNCFYSEGLKASDALWLLEQYKAWLLGLARK